MKLLTNKIFIYAFLFLYALVAFISFCHAIEFFDIGNTHWMSIMLAFAFELGLAVCLASILIGANKRSNIAWILLTILVLVQVIGNTYSVFKFISESGYDYYNYLAKPMLFMIEEVSQETVQVIISWIMGAILPIVALLMTEMVANGIKETQMIDDPKNEPINEPINDHIENHKLTEDENEMSEVPFTIPDVSDEKEEQINLDNDNDEILIKDDIAITPEEDQENKEEITPFENENVIESEETTVNNEETQKNDEFIEQNDKPEVNENEGTSNKEYGLKNKNHKKFVVIDNKEPKQMFDELKKESLN